ncbi:DUF6794 domain-containing protein, partial [Anaerobaca lacustris]|nr:hypothetical protein [Sedimentisphaerales bacterium M17dextr]
MMRLVSFLLVLLLVSLVAAQEAGTTNPASQKPPTLPEEHLARIRAETERLKKEQENAPRTLAEAHARLEQMLSAEELAKIDAMPSEDGMAIYHFGLGLNIRNGWGLWKGGPLAQHMRELGFSHPDIMSGVILKTFWCKRHGQDFRLEARAGRSKRSVEVDQQLRVEQDSRVRASNGAMRYMMMGLRFEEQDVPVVQIPTHRGISVRFMRPFRDGVFLTACSRWPPRQGLVLTDGYYADPASGQARRRPGMDDSVVRGLYL